MDTPAAISRHAAVGSIFGWEVPGADPACDLWDRVED